MLLYALTNTYLGLRKSKDEDKADAIPKKTYIYIFYNIISFYKWGNNSLEKAWYKFFMTFEFCHIYFSLFQEHFMARNTKIRDVCFLIKPLKNMGKFVSNILFTYFREN